MAADTETIEFDSYAGRPQTREFRQTLDIRDYLGTGVYPWLVMAANRHLSAFDISMYLDSKDETTPGAYRPTHWIARRMRMVRPPGAVSTSRADRDGNQAQAIAVMAANPTLSLRDLTKLLRSHGIVRAKDWVRNHRVTG